MKLNYNSHKKLCPKCNSKYQIRPNGYRYCRNCYNAYMRNYSPKYRLTHFYRNKKEICRCGQLKVKSAQICKKCSRQYYNKKRENNNNWQGGITPINAKIRNSLEYKLWRQAVFERDNYTCIWCSIIGNGENLNADHIKPFALFPALRFAIDNGRTLCISCHRKTDTYGSKSKKGNLSALGLEK